MDDTNLYALVITVSTVLITTKFKYITTKIPGSFIAIISITLLVHFLHLPVTTIETFFGTIPNDITFSLPNFELVNLSTYLVPAFIIVLLGGVESLLSAVVADGMIGGNLLYLF